MVNLVRFKERPKTVPGVHAFVSRHRPAHGKCEIAISHRLSEEEEVHSFTDQDTNFTYLFTTNFPADFVSDCSRTLTGRGTTVLFKPPQGTKSPKLHARGANLYPDSSIQTNFAIRVGLLDLDLPYS